MDCIHALKSLYKQELYPFGVLIHNEIDVLPLNNNIGYAISGVMLYTFYKLFYFYPQFLSLLFYSYPTHRTLVEIRKIGDIDLKILILWLGVTFMEIFGKILYPFPSVRIVVFYNIIKHTNDTVFVDNIILQCFLETHKIILKKIKEGRHKLKYYYKNE